MLGVLCKIGINELKIWFIHALKDCDYVSVDYVSKAIIILILESCNVLCRLLKKPTVCSCYFIMPF